MYAVFVCFLLILPIMGKLFLQSGTRMIRVLAGTFFLLALFFPSCLQAGCSRDSVRLVTGGVKAEVNASGYFLPGVSREVVDIHPGSGASAGGFIFFDFHRHFGLQMEWLFHLRTSEMNRDIHSGDVSHGHFLYAGMEVPFYFVVHWDMPDCSRLYLCAGPTVDFGYFAKVRENGQWIDLYEKNDETELSAMQDVSMGLGIVFGYEFDFGLQINISAKTTGYNVLDEHRTEVGAYPYSVSAGLAYRFGVVKGGRGRHGR